MSDNPSPVDDGKSAVAGNTAKQISAGGKFGVLALVGVIAVALIWFHAFSNQESSKRAYTNPATYANGGEDYTAPPAAAPKPAPAMLPQPALIPQSTSLFGTAPQQTPASAPILAYSGSENIPAPAASNTAAGGAGGPQPARSEGAPSQAGPDNSPLAARLKPTVLDGEQATFIQNPDMVITEGTMIPCILQTAIDSQLPGLVTCIVPIDIRGSTGNVVLLDRGTKIVGQIQNGLLQGQNRVFVDWTRAETPDHVMVTLDSPGSDELGRSGLPGTVNNHFWERFGGAIMLTLVQGGLNAATIEAAGQGSSNSTTQQAGLGFVYAAQSNGQSVANTALQNTINIAPTLSKNQGDMVSLIVAHDLDFSSVYRLQVNGTASVGAGNGG